MSSYDAPGPYKIDADVDGVAEPQNHLDLKDDASTDAAVSGTTQAQPQ